MSTISPRKPLKSHCEHERVAAQTFWKALVEPNPSGSSAAVSENTSNFYVTNSYAVNPAIPDTFPWGHNVARQYSKWRHRKVKFTLKPSASDVYSGTWYIGWSPDTLQESPVSSTEFELLTVKNYGAVKDDKPISITIPLPTMGDDDLFTRSAGIQGVDLKTYDNGRIYVACDGVINDFTGVVPATLLLGYLDVEYDFVLDEQKPIDRKDGSLVPVGSMTIAAATTAVPGSVAKVLVTNWLNTGTNAYCWPCHGLYRLDAGAKDLYKGTNHCNVEVSSVNFKNSGSPIPTLTGASSFRCASDGVYKVNIKLPIEEENTNDTTKLKNAKLDIALLESTWGFDVDIDKSPVTGDFSTPTLAATSTTAPFSKKGVGTSGHSNTDFLADVMMLAGKMYTPLVKMDPAVNPSATSLLKFGSTIAETLVTFTKIAELGEAILPALIPAAGFVGANVPPSIVGLKGLKHHDLRVPPTPPVVYPDNTSPYRARFCSAAGEVLRKGLGSRIQSISQWQSAMRPDCCSPTTSSSSNEESHPSWASSLAASAGLGPRVIESVPLTTLTRSRSDSKGKGRERAVEENDDDYSFCR
jgi:hypothetical protein